MPQTLRSWLRDRLSWDPCLLVEAWSRIVPVVAPEDKMKVDLDQAVIVGKWAYGKPSRPRWAVWPFWTLNCPLSL